MKLSNSFTLSLLSLAILAVLGWRGVAENETNKRKDKTCS